MSERVCSVEGCDKPHKSRGWCRKHYLRFWRHGDPLTVKQPGRPRKGRPPWTPPPQPRRRATPNQRCSITGCNRKHHAIGFCLTHYRPRRRELFAHRTPEQIERDRQRDKATKRRRAQRRHQTEGAGDD